MTGEFYPGSSRKRKNYEDLPPEPTPEPEELVLGKPRTYLVNGQPVDFYYIGDVARALNRKPVTIRKMENHSQLPLSPYTAPGTDERGKRRLYTKTQIEALRRIADEEGILYPTAGGKWKAIEETNFTKRATEAFRNTTV